MITYNKLYQYAELPRVDSPLGRKYNTPSGKLPSVTTILSATKPKESKEKLENWRRRVGNLEATKITTEAANVGTILHSCLEHWALGKEYDPGNNLIHRQAKQMAEKIKENIFPNITEIWGSEINLYYPDLYAGTTDLIGLWNGNPSIMDFKQTNKPKKIEYVTDYFLQLTAYSLAHNEIYGTDIKEGHIIMCSRDLQFQQFDLTPENFNYWEDQWLLRLETYYNLN